MKHAYLIMAHNEEEILKMLLKRLDSEQNTLYVHLDKKFKIDINHLESIVKKSKIHFIERRRIYWGTYSQIWCELALLEEAVKEKHDYYHLLTGVDLPLKPNEEIDSFFEANKGKEFVSFDKVANETRNFTKRYDKFYFCARYSGKNVILKMVCRLCHLFLRVCAEILSLVVRNRSKKYYDFIFMKGSAYFDITHDLATYVLKHKNLIRKMFRFTACCDEVFLHTIAYNSPFKEKLTFRGTRFLDWSNHRGSPEILTMDHYDDIYSSKLLFARKFSNVASRELIEKLYGDNCDNK